ncbi:phenol-soluble modulin export ABC transporter ATP-binding protein PmtA [Aquisalibacillus elongatus]|uniref:ABC-2 type transport system ATP-binding protein n=1 Tax=Aquisalibacillus elongatus TaxID=485577 RepID=A0A3N5B4K5_9BACI|nr:ABC transporter ATP-binding protein [Aquisalibacillus elongatus]RPF52207.1 ABC-2 type transport system ATP-binding protein [Aquisalibacillus elongatus]
MENVVKFENVNKSFNDFQLNDVCFSVKKGYITGFIGPNGSGKTTTIKLIMSLLKRNSGDLKVFGEETVANSKEIKQRIGFVYAENHFYNHLSVKQMKRLVSSFYDNWDESTFQSYMKYFNLPWKKKIKHLSTGMRMKLSLAIALSHDAELIIMDEPTSGLDPVFRREILDILSEIIQDENKTVFFSTHITTDLEQIADYITFIYNGEIIFDDEKDHILEKYHIIRGAKELLDDDIRQMFIHLRETSVGFEALTDNPQKVRNLMGNDIIMEPASLEEIMVYTVRSGQHA